MFLTRQGSCVLMRYSPTGPCRGTAVHTATQLEMDPSLWLRGPFNKLCPEAVSKLPGVSLNIISCSLFISHVLPCSSCWNSTWTGQCSMDLLLTGRLFHFCCGQSSPVLGTHMKGGYKFLSIVRTLEPSFWNPWRLGFKSVMSRSCFCWPQGMATALLPSLWAEDPFSSTTFLHSSLREK